MELNRTMPPALKPVTDLQLIQPREYRLTNGIKVYSINAGKQEMVKVDFIFSGGFHHQPQNCLANAATKLMMEGTKKRKASEISELFDYYGSFIQEDCDAESSTITLYCLNKHLESLLPLVIEVLTEAVYPEKEIEIYKENCKQRLAVNKMKNGYLSKTYFNNALFGSNHPEGTIIEATDYDALNRDLLVQYYKKTFGLENCRIIISGSADQQEIDLLDKFFGQQPIKNSEIIRREYEIKPSEKKYHFHEKQDSLQAGVVVGKFLFDRSHPDYYGMNLLNLILGGYFGSRLMKNIREDKGYTYGIHSGVVSYKNTGIFYIKSEVKNEVFREVLEEINKEIKLLQTTLVDETELNTARNYLLGNFLRSFDGPFAMSDRFKMLLENGLDYDYFYNYINTVKTITAEKLRELANNHLNTEDLYSIVVGKE